MSYYNRRRSSSRRTGVGQATPQELAQNKQTLVAKVDYIDTYSRLFQFIGPTPQAGDVAVFFLNVVRGKPTATVFVVPPTGNKDMLATEIRVTTGRVPHDATPIAQYRSLCFYRAALTVLEMLRKTAPEDRNEMLHYMKCFELHIKQCVRTGRLSPAVLESKWRKYTGVRELYLRPATEGESNAARQGVLRVVRQFLTITT